MIVVHDSEFLLFYEVGIWEYLKIFRRGVVLDE